MGSLHFFLEYVMCITKSPPAKTWPYAEWTRCSIVLPLPMPPQAISQYNSYANKKSREVQPEPGSNTQAAPLPVSSSCITILPSTHTLYHTERLSFPKLPNYILPLPPSLPNLQNQTKGVDKVGIKHDTAQMKQQI